MHEILSETDDAIAVRKEVMHICDSILDSLLSEGQIIRAVKIKIEVGCFEKLVHGTRPAEPLRIEIKKNVFQLMIVDHELDLSEIFMPAIVDNDNDGRLLIA